jgi:predicted transcriptional regulator
MDAARPYAAVVPAVDGATLQVLAGATRPLTSREVHHAIGSGSESSVRRVLTRLVEHGVVRASQGARAREFTANREHLAWDVVEALLSLRQTLVERLRTELAGWTVPAGTAAVYGAFAGGDGTTGSEVELLLVRGPISGTEVDTWRDQVDRLRGLVAAWTGNDCHVRDLDDAGLDALVQAGDPAVAAWRRDALVVQGDALSRLHFQVADWFG